MSEPITFVTWLWAGPPGSSRYNFTAEAVNTLFRMIDRHYPAPHRNVCVTNLPDGIASSTEIVPDREDFAWVTNPSGSGNPSCYRRLRAFHPQAGDTFGPRLVSFDLDTVIVDDLRPLFDRPEDFIIWGESDYPKTQWFNGSLWMLRTGSRPQVWTSFDPYKSPRLAAKAHCRGSDQGWIAYVLGPREATWGRKDGIYSWRKHLAPQGGQLPANARVISWHGRQNPWSYEMQRVSWVQEAYA